MAQKFIFVFILLVTLSIIDAMPLQKRSTSFLACPIVDPPPPTLTVTLSSDPPVAGEDETFTISGNVPSEISADTMFLVGFFDGFGTNPLALPIAEPLCDRQDEPPCPIQPNTDFKVVTSIPMPSPLPDPYIIEIAVGNPTSDPKTPTDVIYACAYAVVGTSPSSTSIISPSIAEIINSFPIAGAPTASYSIA